VCDCVCACVRLCGNPSPLPPTHTTPAPSGITTLKKTWKHKEEVWALAACPFDAGLVLTGHHDSTRNAVTLWRMGGVVSTLASDDSGSEGGEDGEGHHRAAPAAAGAGAGYGTESSRCVCLHTGRFPPHLASARLFGFQGLCMLGEGGVPPVACLQAVRVRV
jgi:hypothetical protein